MDRGRYYAESYLGMRGVYFPVGIGPLGIKTKPPGTSAVRDATTA